MINTNNIPDPKQSWLAAEKILDRHFRNLKILRISLSVVIPAAIIGLALLFGNHKKEIASVVSYGESNITPTNSTDYIKSENPVEVLLSPDTKAKIQSSKHTSETISQNIQSNLNDNGKDFSRNNRSDKLSIADNTNPAAIPDINHQTENRSSGKVNYIKPKKSKRASAKNANNDFINSASTSVNQKSSSTASIDPVQSKPGLKLGSGQGFVPGEKGKKNAPSSLAFESENSLNHTNSSTLFRSNPSEPEASLEPIAFLSNFESLLDIPSVQNDASDLNWPKPVVKESSRLHISWEASVYGGAQYINKKLRTNNDWKNYLNHRQNEEDAVLTPSFGIALSANMKLFSISVGAEYSSYGEKTKYYPFSIADSIATNGMWQSYITSYTDYDTAYITGNPYILSTILQRQDSSYVIQNDTMQVSKYDQEIAKRNGVNRISYIEFPVEMSFCFTQGKAGMGITGGLSPSLLISQKGNYLRRDGRGIESFSEIETFRKFMLNARLSADFYYRFNGRAKLLIRPQIKSNLNSVFDNKYGVNQKYYSTGILFGISYMLN